MTKDIVPQGVGISFPYVYGAPAAHLYPNVSVSIETITPEVAERMLGANIRNRDINDTTVVMAALRNDEWELNGATIVFDENGILRDGQHRLYSCMKTGKTIVSVVVRGINGESQITMDTGTRRALRDYTKMRGYKDYSTVATLGLALYLIDNYGLTAYVSAHYGGKTTYKSVINFIDTVYSPRIEPLVSDVRGITKKYKHVNAGVIGGAFDAFRVAGEENYRVFLEQLLNRRTACVSVRLLQNVFEKQSSEQIRAKRLTDKYVMAYIIKAWNAYMRGDDIKLLKFTQGGANPEKFPEVFLGYE